MQTDALITAAAAALILGVSSSTVRRLAESGDLPFVQKLPGPNGAYLFDEAVVRQHLADHAETAPAAAASP
jgi:excisionase family DNA binding protein